MGENIFAIVPIEVLADRRLTLEQMRVLIAIFSFRNRETGLAWPTRAALSERCGGIHVSNISSATTALCKLGWLVKSGNVGNSRSSEYAIKIPEGIANVDRVAEQATLADSATLKTVNSNEKLSTGVAELTTLNDAGLVAESARGLVAESARGLVAESARGLVAESARSKEQINEQIKEQTIEQTTAGAADGREAEIELLAARGVSEKLAGDWLALRSKKRLPCIDALILGAIQAEADKAGFDFQKTIQTCCDRGWGGFKQSWLAADLSDSDWFRTDEGILKKGVEVRLIARRGESMASFADRIKARLSKSK